MIGYRPLPGNGARTVAARAVGGIPGLLVVGVGGGVVIGHVAARALGRGADVLTVLVTGGTCGGLVGPVQREAGVIEGRPLPGKGLDAVAGRAVGGIARGVMVRVRRVVVVVPVTVNAIGRQVRIDPAAVTIGTTGGFV